MRCCACSGRTRSFGILAATRAAFSIVLICPQAAARGRSNVTSKAKSARVSPDFDPSWSLPCERNVERSPELAGAQTAAPRHPHRLRYCSSVSGLAQLSAKRPSPVGLGGLRTVRSWPPASRPLSRRALRPGTISSSAQIFSSLSACRYSFVVSYLVHGFALGASCAPWVDFQCSNRRLRSSRISACHHSSNLWEDTSV